MKNKHEVKYSKNCEWLKPFVDSAKGLVPLAKLKKVTGYAVRPGIDEGAWGSLHTTNHKRFEMRLRLFKHSKDKNVPLSCEMILLTLAHELAHMLFWQHEPGHFELQSQIGIRFSKVLKENGIPDHARSANEVRRN